MNNWCGKCIYDLYPAWEEPCSICEFSKPSKFAEYGNFKMEEVYEILS